MNHMTAEFAFADAIDGGANALLHAVARHLLADDGPGVLDVVPGYVVLAVEYDPRHTTHEEIEQRVRTAMDRVEPQPRESIVDVPAQYDGVDLAFVAAACGLSEAEVVRRHTSRTYRVFALGFTPGFPFLGSLDERIRLPRRKVPRAAVAAHSIALANEQTGIYPLASPGGWHVVGTALVPVYDPRRPEPFLLEPGDQVRFVPARGPRPPDPRHVDLLPTEPWLPVLEVVRPGLLDLVVDRGRFRSGRYGLARSGPVDPVSATAANHMLANASFAPSLEINVGGPTLKILRETLLAVAGLGVVPILNGRELPTPRAFEVRPGDMLTFRPIGAGVRAYLAVPGGIESRRHRGSVSVDVRGLIGRPLREGDVLGQTYGWPSRTGFAVRPIDVPLPAVLGILQGPQGSVEALRALTSGSFTVAQADRMGIRLSGNEVPGGEVISEPTALGAIQVTAGGNLLILLNDRGTLGGYAKPALIDPRDLWMAGQLRVGDGVRFTARDRGPAWAGAGGARVSLVASSSSRGPL